MDSPAGKGRRPERVRRPKLAWMLAPPTTDDLIRLLSAWRLWILGGLVAASLGAVSYAVVPPPFRARATVNVDFHMEQAWPNNSDREQFYYLERETRKLVEIALSDRILEVVTREVPGITIEQLRAGAALLSQPGNGGWHFFGIDPNPRRAASIATSWAAAFAAEVERQIASAQPVGLEQFITADFVQAGSLDPERSVGVGTYMLAFVVVLLSAGALSLLLIRPRQ